MRIAVWPSPPVIVTAAVIDTTLKISRGLVVTRLRITSGMNFWTVVSSRSPPHVEVVITLKNQVWHGARPSFTTMARAATIIAPLTVNRLARVREKKNQSDATACTRKYLTLFSS